ncbi:MAG TPA: hypothetical protein VF273_00570 [Pelobium sp.]
MHCRSFTLYSPLAFALQLKGVRALPLIAKGAGESFFGYFFSGKKVTAIARHEGRRG